MAYTIEFRGTHDVMRFYQKRLDALREIEADPGLIELIKQQYDAALYIVRRQGRLKVRFDDGMPSIDREGGL